jgi:HEPN domain-containing protein
MDTIFKGSWELESYHEPEKLLCFAKAYLAASKALCERCKQNLNSTTYADGCVVMFTAYHAVELLLKAMILAKNSDAKLHHDVEDMAKEYHRLYPKKDYFWRVPFSIEAVGDDIDTRQTLQKLKKELPVDQLWRYPISKAGTQWNGAFAFEPMSFMDNLILPLELDFDRLENLIFTKHDCEALDR